MVKIGCFGDVLRLYKKYFTRRVMAPHVVQRARAEASLSHVKVFRVRADGVFDKDGV